MLIHSDFRLSVLPVVGTIAAVISLGFCTAWWLTSTGLSRESQAETTWPFSNLDSETQHPITSTILFITVAWPSLRERKTDFTLEY
jgi:hypothetical protein